MWRNRSQDKVEVIVWWWSWSVFFVVALSDTYKASRSDIINDKGENLTHQTVVPFLRPSVLYTFYVFAKNSIGVTLSEELNCTTLKGIVISLWYSQLYIPVNMFLSKANMDSLVHTIFKVNPLMVKKKKVFILIDFSEVKDITLCL